MKLLKLLAACCLAATAPLTAQEQVEPATEPTSAVVVIPLNPPLDRTLAYRFTTVETRNGEPTSVSLTMRIRFRRDGGAFVLTMSSDVPPGIPRSHPLHAALSTPFDFRVSTEGEITELIDEAAYWRLMDRAMADIVRGLGGENEPGGRAAQTAFEQMRRLPAPDRLALLARNILPVVEFSGTEMRIGEPVETRLTGDSILGPVEQHMTITLEGVADGVARFETRMRLPADQMDRLVRELERRFGAPARSMDAAANMLPPERHDSYQVSLASGVTERYESRFTTPARDGAPAQALKTVRLELIQ
jgi:hypothetical protein